MDIAIQSLYFLACVIASTHGHKEAKPNVVLVLADDYGFNDIGYHGVNHGSAIKTPFLDSLAMSGIRLENYYVQQKCTPTRSQLMSGRYQIHTGLQHEAISSNQPNGLPLNNILLPENLKKCGYDTHMLGKWHLGFFKDEYLPWKRGFDSYFGYLVGEEDYYTKIHCRHFCGYSMNSETGPTNETFGEYSAHVYARKAGEIIEKHNNSNPIFMYIALQSVHSPLQVPPEYIKPYSHIRDEKRRIYAGMVSAMDETVKNITEHLQRAGMWNNTLFIFSTDNGGNVTSGGNNWPLRGGKNSLWEGGIRGVGFVHGAMLNLPNPNTRINKELIHISDWYPTLLSATGCSAIPQTQTLNGLDQWKTISTYAESPRTEILHNIDPLNSLKDRNLIHGFDTSIQAAIRVGDWKLLTGCPGNGSWTIPPEAKHLQHSAHIVSTYQVSSVKCISSHLGPFAKGVLNKIASSDEKKKTFQLYNIKNDPYEKQEISHDHPHVVRRLLEKLAEYNFSAVPLRFPEGDLAANPQLHGGFWQPWKN